MKKVSSLLLLLLISLSLVAQVNNKSLSKDATPLGGVGPEVYLALQPKDQSVCPSATAYFIAKAGNWNYKYWEQSIDNGLSWQRIPGTEVSITPLSDGQVPDTLTLINVTQVMNNYKYRCQYYGIFYSYFFTQSATLKVGCTVEACVSKYAQIVSSLTGSNYQWQINRINDDNGFVDIYNDANYNGTNTSTLNVLISPSYDDYQYRCIVNGSISNVITLKINNRWIGTGSTWENPTNWSCGILPDANTNVTIDSGHVIINSPVSVKSLTLKSPVSSLTVYPAGSLNVVH